MSLLKNPWYEDTTHFRHRVSKANLVSQRKGTALSSFCSTLIEDGEAKDPQGDFDLRWTANSMYSGA